MLRFFGCPQHISFFPIKCCGFLDARGIKPSKIAPFNVTKPSVSLNLLQPTVSSSNTLFKRTTCPCFSCSSSTINLLQTTNSSNARLLLLHQLRRTHCCYKPTTNPFLLLFLNPRKPIVVIALQAYMSLL